MSPLFTSEAKRVWMVAGVEDVLRFVGWLNEHLPADTPRKDLEECNSTLRAFRLSHFLQGLWLAPVFQVPFSRSHPCVL